MDKMILGSPCIIAQQIKKQKKTSRCKFLNWIYKKVYGYKYESMLPEGTDFIFYDGKYIFKDEETYDKLKYFINNQQH